MNYNINLTNFKYKDLIELKCPICNKTFRKTKQYIIQSKHKKKQSIFCSKKCRDKNQITKIKLKCINCNKPVEKTLSQYKKYPNTFCSCSCSTTYNNKHKDYGYRRSKLEKYIETLLQKEFPNLDIKFNSKSEIDSELDIYIPSLKLAFEINGIFHYEPIYSKDQFKRIKNNDKQKLIECYKQGIELCVINTSDQKRFTKNSSKTYYNIIKELIQTNIKRSQ